MWQIAEVNGVLTRLHDWLTTVHKMYIKESLSLTNILIK